MDKDKEVTIKVENYLPLYGLLLSNEYILSIDGKNLITVAELFEQHPDFELNYVYVEMLNSFDRGSFQKYLKNKKNELEALKFIRELFDEFKDNGGNPLEWIYSTLTDIELNFFNYPALLRGVIQTKLLEWADYYEKIKTPVSGTPEAQVPEAESKEEKIIGILEPLGGAFKDNTHITKIIDALISDKSPNPSERAVLYMEMNEFIKPFGRLFADGLLKRGFISQTLCLSIKKNNINGDPNYSEDYLNKLLSNCKKHIELTEGNTKV